MKPKLRHVLAAIGGGASAMLSASAQGGAGARPASGTYDRSDGANWRTGAVDGDWTNTANRGANSVPVDFIPSTSGLGSESSTDRIVIDSTNSSPTLNGPSLYATKDIFNTESSLAGYTRISPGSSMTVGYATSQEFISLITHLRPPQTKPDQQ